MVSLRNFPTGLPLPSKRAYRGRPCDGKPIRGTFFRPAEEQRDPHRANASPRSPGKIVKYGTRGQVQTSTLRRKMSGGKAVRAPRLRPRAELRLRNTLPSLNHVAEVIPLGDNPANGSNQEQQHGGCEPRRNPRLTAISNAAATAKGAKARQVDAGE